MTPAEDHNHPRSRLTPGAAIRAQAGSDDEDDQVISYDREPERVEPLLAAIGAGFDHCRSCVARHAEALADDPLLIVWLAWGVGVMVGQWVKIPTGDNPQRLRFFASRVDPAAAKILDALYADPIDGVAAALAAAEVLPRDARIFAVGVLVQALFHGMRTMDGPVEQGEAQLLNTGSRLDWMDQHGAFGW